MVNLTEREIAILKYIAIGYNNNKISKKLYISIHTVKAHICSIVKKLNAKNRTNAVYLALKSNLIN